MPKDHRNAQERKQGLDKFHGAITKVTNSPKYRDVLEKFEDDPEAAKRDPKGFLKQHGIDLPDDATVEVHERQGSYCYCLRICFLWWCSDVCVCVS